MGKSDCGDKKVPSTTVVDLVLILHTYVGLSIISKCPLCELSNFPQFLIGNSGAREESLTR